MRSFVAITLALSVVLPATVSCTDGHVQAAQILPNPYEYRKRPGLEIRVLGDDWGSARPQDIETVLYSVAAILLEHFPGRRLYPILVTHAPNHPMTLFKRGPANEYLVRLSARDRQWARYAYEFAHELAHILTNYQHHALSRTLRPNQWFEEALCEAASLYALKRLAFVWEMWPPHREWAAYAPEFQRYVERFLSESHRQLPRDVTLAAWFRRHEKELQGKPYSRGHNEVVANVLLPLFEENAEFWEAIGYLNLQGRSGSFREYLQAWHDNAPEEHRDLIRYIMALFGVLPDGQSTAAGGSAGVDDPSSSGAAGRGAR